MEEEEKPHETKLIDSNSGNGDILENELPITQSDSLPEINNLPNVNVLDDSCKVESSPDETDCESNNNDEPKRIVEYRSSSSEMNKDDERSNQNINVNKLRRLLGKSCLANKNKQIRKKKILPNPCLNKRCYNDCNILTEDERKKQFKTFWALKSDVQKHSFVNSCVHVIPVKRKRTSEEVSRRNFTYQYFVMSENGPRRVCLHFFLNTLGISQKFVRNSLEGKIK